MPSHLQPPNTTSGIVPVVKAIAQVGDLKARWVGIDELQSRCPDLTFLEQNSICRCHALESNYLIPALRHLGSEAVRLLIVENPKAETDQRIVALVPIEEKRIYGLPFKTAEIWKHDHCFNTTPLLLNGLATEAWRVVCEKLIEDGFSLLSLDTVSAGPEFNDHLEAVEQSLQFARFQRQLFERPAWVSMETSQQYLKQHVSKKVQANGRRMYRRLAEKGVVTWEASEPGSDFEQLAEDFLKIESSGWKGQKGTALACHASTAAFFRELVRESATQSKARFLSLKFDGQPIAMLSDFCSGSEVYSFKTAYDERFAYYSPGQQAIVKNIEHLHRDGIKLADSCALPESSTFNRIWGQRLLFQNILYSLRPGMARSVVKTLPLLQSVTGRKRK